MNATKGRVELTLESNIGRNTLDNLRNRRVQSI